MSLSELIQVARGTVPADLILKNAKIVNTFNGEIEEGNIAIYQDRIAGVGDYRTGSEIIDLSGSYVSPGLINGHVHIESSMLHVARYAEAVIPRGVTGIVTDLHEIANVLGIPGVEYLLRAARSLPLDLHLMAPSCVPATASETSGASLAAKEVRRMLTFKECLGLGEMMDFPGVLSSNRQALAKLRASRSGTIDGHAPGLDGRALNAYIAGGISSDHECTRLAEAAEKLSKGMYVMIREGSSEKNLEELIPLVTDKTYKRCILVVDDRNCSDLLHDGDVDAVIRKAIRLGMDPIRAIQMATINPAEHFRIPLIGAVAPGYRANFVVLGDLPSFQSEMVFHDGILVARSGTPLFTSAIDPDSHATRSMNVKPFTVDHFRISAEGYRSPIIEIVPNQIITRRITVEATIRDGAVVADPQRDILKAAVVERHRTTGNIGIGLVKGFGLKRGALASSIAHDSHNIVTVGVDDRDLYKAVSTVESLGGGLAVVADGAVLASLPLPIAGLLSDQPLTAVVDKFEAVKQAAAGLGSTLDDPFASMSFLALPVIPELRLTDRGLVEV